MIQKKSAAQLIKELNATDETEELEAKEQSSLSVSKTVYETICALANEPDLGGGTILLGVEKEEALFSFYTPSGVKNPDKISSDIASSCATTFNQPIRIDIKPELIGEKTVLRIDVPELPPSQKPLYFKATGLPKGAFRRIGPTDIRCTDEDLQIFYQGKGSDPFDVRIVKDASWDDIDPLAVIAYRSARKEANPLAEELNWSDEDLLFALGSTRNVEGVVRITYTGLLSFGKQSALRRLLPSHRVDYVRVKGTTWFNKTDEPVESLDMRGPLMSLIPRIIAAVSDDLPRTLDVEGGRLGQRVEVPVMPYRVIREAVVNAVMHRSYQVFQPVQIIRYANRIVIKNPGYSLKSQDRFDTPGSSLRNPTIAAIMHETRFAETKGSGIRVMQAKMRESGLSAPTFESDRDNDEFTATFLFHHFLNESDWEWLSRFSTLNLTEDQMKALVFVREVGAIDNSTYRNLTHLDTLAASKSLRFLREAELLIDRGSGARTHYVPGPEMLARETSQIQFGGSSLKGTIQDNGPILDGAIQDKGHRMPDLPIPLRKQVLAIQLKKRLPADSIKEIIEALCGWKALSAEEISRFIQRDRVYTSQQFLGPMISEGRLTYLFPEMVQHPDQKYKTKITPEKPRGRKVSGR